MSAVTEFRYGIGRDIILDMEEDKVFPIRTKYLLAGEMAKRFKQDYQQFVLDEGYNWHPERSYWYFNLSEIRRVLREENDTYLESHIVGTGENPLQKEWDILSEEDLELKMVMEHNGIATRHDTYNERRNNTSAPALEEILKIGPVNNE